MFEKIRKELIKMSDKEMAKLTAKVCPDTSIEDILGIKISELRKKAKTIANSNEFEQYIEESNKVKNKKYIEEIILHGLVIAYSKIELEKKLEYMKIYIPQIGTISFETYHKEMVCEVITIPNTMDDFGKLSGDSTDEDETTGDDGASSAFSIMDWNESYMGMSM